MFKKKKSFKKFEFWKFEFVSDFDIRISNFFNAKAHLVLAWPG